MTTRTLVGAALGLALLPMQVYASVDAGEVVRLTNQDRASAGLAPLTRNSLLDTAAAAKAQDMVSRGYYAHVSPDGTTPIDFIRKAGYQFVNAGENLDVNATSAHSAEQAWMHSASHRENILRSEFTEIGVAVAEGTYDGEESTYVVQLFATPVPRVTTPVLVTTVAPKVAVVPITSVSSHPGKMSIPDVPLATQVRSTFAPLVSLVTSVASSSAAAFAEPVASTSATSTDSSIAPHETVVVPLYSDEDLLTRDAFHLSRPTNAVLTKPTPKAEVSWYLFVDSLVRVARSIFRFY